ncbi:MAG: rubrerythrin family protein [Ginsengibacter sp.]
MKKLLIIPVSLLAISSLFFISCGNGGSTSEMKSPVAKTTDSTTQHENNKQNDNQSLALQTSMKESTGTNSKTTENMQAAFKGETTASAKYAAYSKKAEQEGYHEIALLFKAASTSENIHANNHKAVLQESGFTVPSIKPEFTVKTTKENLQDAITGETYEVTTMYPDFLTVANKDGNQIAMISLNYAYKTEKKHKVFYEEALAALQNNTVKSLPKVFYVCPTCGNTYETKAPARCGISMTSGERFLKITSL